MVRGRKTSEYLVQEIRTLFLSSPKRLTVKQLAEQFPEISFYQIQHFYTEQKWPKAREEYQKELAHKTLVEIQSQMALQRADDIEKISILQNTSMKKLLRAIEDDRYLPTPKDVEILTRLKGYLLGEADMIVGVRREESVDLKHIINKLEKVAQEAVKKPKALTIDMGVEEEQ